MSSAVQSFDSAAVEEPSADEIAAAVNAVKDKIAEAVAKQPPEMRGLPVRLVAVSKFKSLRCLQSAYDAGVRVFGENYVQELVGKAPHMPSDARWHFIGHLQSNKAKELVLGVPTLDFVETVDSQKLAAKLDAAVSASPRAATPLNVMVQVNTSGEPSKSGVDPADEGACEKLAEFIVTQCPHLAFRGLMTIGMPDYSSTPENFESLRRARARVAAALKINPSSLELSMGMSADYEAAIAMGSTNVRVGSTIFGKRPSQRPISAGSPTTAAK